MVLRSTCDEHPSADICPGIRGRPVALAAAWSVEPTPDLAGAAQFGGVVRLGYELHRCRLSGNSADKARAWRKGGR